MSTFLCQVEVSPYSWPISAISDNADSLLYLIPGQFLTGSHLLSIPEPSVLNSTENRLSRWELMQKLNRLLWKRWSIEYFQRLQNRYQWQNRELNVNKDDIVLIRDDNNPSCEWNLGRVISCHPGQDNLVRAVTVKIAEGVYKKPIVKLCLLPINKET